MNNNNNNADPKEQKTEAPFDYKFCRRCGHKIYVIGDKFCSDYCEEIYKIRLKKMLS